MHNLLSVSPFHILARGGGGGSSSGGSGGGGLLALVYAGGHVVGHFARRKVHGILSWIIVGLGIFAFCCLALLGFSDTSGSALSFYTVLAALVGIIGILAGRFGWFDGITNRLKKGRAKAAQAAQTDSKFDTTTLIPQMKDLFIRFQNDWQNFDTDSLQTYLTPRYFEHVRLQLAALYMMGRQNLVSNVQFYDVGVTDLTDTVSNDGDRVEIVFNAVAHDQLIRTADQNVLMTDDSEFTEFWELDSTPDGRWLLDGIRQATEDTYRLRDDIATFARTNNLYYSPDWGRLLLPGRGELFSGATFKTSDINNHCIGLYHNILIQLYTYQPIPNQQTYDKIIAQVTVPKQYGRILIRPKQNLLQRPFSHPSGLNRLETEWQDFNQRYELWADHAEQVTTFELLQPSYMEQLYGLPFTVTIEVVDNVIYLATDTTHGNYQGLMQCLIQAFTELKM